MEHFLPLLKRAFQFKSRPSESQCSLCFSCIWSLVFTAVCNPLPLCECTRLMSRLSSRPRSAMPSLCCYASSLGSCPAVVTLYLISPFRSVYLHKVSSYSIIVRGCTALGLFNSKFTYHCVGYNRTGACHRPSRQNCPTNPQKAHLPSGALCSLEGNLYLTRAPWNRILISSWTKPHRLKGLIASVIFVVWIWIPVGF